MAPRKGTNDGIRFDTRWTSGCMFCMFYTYKYIYITYLPYFPCFYTSRRFGWRITSAPSLEISESLRGTKQFFILPPLFFPPATPGFAILETGLHSIWHPTFDKPEKITCVLDRWDVFVPQRAF